MTDTMYDNRQRDGISSLLKLAKQMCLLTNTFGPIIEKKYRNSPSVLAALEAARAVCAIVPALDTVANNPEGDYVPPEDPADWPGVDPSALPPYVEPAP